MGPRCVKCDTQYDEVLMGMCRTCWTAYVLKEDGEAEKLLEGDK